jgi:hypothetical protein
LRTDRLLWRSWRHEDRQTFAQLNADPIQPSEGWTGGGFWRYATEVSVPSAREIQAGAVAMAITVFIVSAVLIAGRLFYHPPPGGWGGPVYVQPTSSNP